MSKKHNFNDDYEIRLKNKLQELRPTPFDTENKKILVVEGYLDSKFFNEKMSVSGIVISVGYLKRRGEILKGNVKNAICNVMTQIHNKEYVMNGLNVYGICDKDIDNNFTENENLFFTDTCDLETLLISHDVFPLCMLSRYDDVAERNIYGLAYQLGGIRKAFLNLKKEEDKNHFTKNKSPRHYFSESILKSFAKSIFVKDKDLNIENLIKLFSKDELNYFHETSGSEELDIIKLNSYLRENSYYDKSNSFIHHISDFNKNNVYSYWENIRGHDLTLICSTILDILIKSPTQIDDFIVNHCEPNNFKKTHLYKRLCNVGLLVNE